MSTCGAKDERLLKRLREAYLAKETLEVGNQWQEDVMHRIRKIEKTGIAQSASAGFTQFTWKLAPVAALLILVLTTFLIGSGLTSGYEMFEFILEGIEELALWG